MIFVKLLEKEMCINVEGMLKKKLKKKRKLSFKKNICICLKQEYVFVEDEIGNGKIKMDKDLVWLWDI